MSKCLKCGNNYIHKPSCSSKNIFVGELENIDFKIEDEVQKAIKKHEEEFLHYGHISSNGNQ
jgi:hypothetical protein